MQTINHPYLKELEKELTKDRDYCAALEKRILLSKQNYESKTEFEKNEIDILIMETEATLNIRKKVVYEREEYFKRFVEGFAKDAEDAEKHLDNLLAQAKQKEKRIVGMSDFLKSLNMDLVKSDIEAKVALYKRLKSMLG